MLVRARQWIRENFETGSRPPLAEVKAWVEDGELPGRVIAGQVFIDADRFASGRSREVKKEVCGIDLLM